MILKPVIALIFSLSILLLSACSTSGSGLGAGAGAGGAPAACTSIPVLPGLTNECPAGGAICGPSEGTHCAGTWPFRKYCTTVWIPGGTCACRCQ